MTLKCEAGTRTRFSAAVGKYDATNPHVDSSLKAFEFQRSRARPGEFGHFKRRLVPVDKVLLDTFASYVPGANRPRKFARRFGASKSAGNLGKSILVTSTGWLARIDNACPFRKVSQDLFSCCVKVCCARTDWQEAKKRCSEI